MIMVRIDITMKMATKELVLAVATMIVTLIFVWVVNVAIHTI